jgi:hypothetical protein
MRFAVGPGELFAGYRVESMVGRGGRGVVYRATDLSLERPIALKPIAPELAENESFRACFRREPKPAALLAVGDLLGEQRRAHVAPAAGVGPAIGTLSFGRGGGLGGRSAVVGASSPGNSSGMRSAYAY